MTTTQPVPSARPEPTTLTARTPEDLVAAVPVVLGFLPTDSVVMLTFGAARPFHARIDLPVSPSTRDLAVIVDHLLEPAVRHGVERVVLLLYTDDATGARRAWSALARGCRRRGLRVVEGLRVDDRCWYPLRDRSTSAGQGRAAGGTPYDVGHHPFALEGIVSGTVVHASRDELAATLRPDPDAVERVCTELERLDAVATSSAPGASESDPVVESRWVAATLERSVETGRALDDVEVARLLRALGDGVLRDVACAALDRARARAFVELWRDVVRRSPGWLLPPAATMLGLSAWVAGHGALAWCAVDRCVELDPDYSLMLLLAELLHQAVPPTTWDDLRLNAFDGGDLEAG